MLGALPFFHVMHFIDSSNPTAYILYMSNRSAIWFYFFSIREGAAV